MLGRNSRTFLHLVAQIEALPRRHGRGRQLWSMSDLSAEIEQYDLPISRSWGRDLHFEWLQCEDREDYVVMLFGHADATLSDPAFRDPKKNTRRVVRKKHGEGLAHCAHLIIGKGRSSATGYPAVLEMAPRVGRASILRMVNEQMRGDIDLLRGRNKKRVYPKLAFEGELSGSLKRALEAGRLQRIDFVRDQVAGEAGVCEPGIAPVAVTQSFKVLRDRPRGWDAGAVLRSMLGRAKAHEFDSIRVRFADPDTDKQQHIDIPTDRDPDADSFFVRTTRREFDVHLEGAPAAIVEDVVKAMVEIMG